MRHVLQRNDDGCGVAALAMILGKTYPETLAIVHPDREPQGSCSTDTKRIYEILNEQNVKFKITHPKELPLFPNNDAIVYIEWRWRLPWGLRAGHWIVWDHERERYLDPGSCWENRSGHRIYTRRNGTQWRRRLGRAFARGHRTCFVIMAGRSASCASP